MKKKITIALAMLFAMLPFSVLSALADEPAVNARCTYVFPLSLQEIGEDAFSGTAAEAVIFPHGLLYIGAGAFSDAWRLADVYIPESTAYIADSAFSRVRNLTVHGVDGSYAGEWAEKHRIPFVVDDIWGVPPRNDGSGNAKGALEGSPVVAINPEKVISVHERGQDEGQSMRPQDRPELNPIDYRFP